MFEITIFLSCHQYAFHHGFRERSVVMFVVDLYLTLSYFVSFVHDYCVVFPLSAFLRLMSVSCFNSVNASCSLRDKLFLALLFLSLRVVI